MKKKNKYDETKRRQYKTQKKMEKIKITKIQKKKLKRQRAMK